MSMTDKARDTIAGHDMLAFSDRVVAGVSGGADSVALLHFLAGLREEFGLEIMAAHLNHGLRGEESERDERFVRGFCKSLGVELRAERSDVAGIAADRGLSLEEAGREARYALFGRLAEERGARIATAHTLNDSVETVILNLARGSALRGLCGIPPVRGNIIRPLIACERREIEEYCRDNGLAYVTDSSNESDDFARNRLRRHVTPVLYSINPGFLGTAAATLEAIRADADYLDGMAGEASRAIEAGDGRFMRKEYLAFERPVRFRILLSLLAAHGIPADSARLSRLDGLVRSGSGAEQLSRSLYLKSGKEYFAFSCPREQIGRFCVRVDVPAPGETGLIDMFSDKKLYLMNTDYEYYEENIKCDEKLLKNTLDCDRINKIVNCRQKIPKDAIRLCGRGCTKTLKKLFQEAGISPEERNRTLVLADADGPLWVEGFGVSERAAVTKDTRRVLILDVKTGGMGNEE